MAALLGLNFEQAREVASEAAQRQVCTAANDNADGQVVVSGHAEAVERAIAIASAKGAKRAVKLPVSAPFHCPLMQPAAEAMQKARAARNQYDVKSCSSDPAMLEKVGAMNAAVRQLLPQQPNELLAFNCN